LNNYTCQVILSVPTTRGCVSAKHLPCFTVSAGSESEAEEKVRDIIGKQKISDIRIY